MLRDRVSQRCIALPIALPRHPFPCQGRKAGAGVHEQQGFKGTLALEKRTVCLVLRGWMVHLVL